MTKAAVDNGPLPWRRRFTRGVIIKIVKFVAPVFLLTGLALPGSAGWKGYRAYNILERCPQADAVVKRCQMHTVLVSTGTANHEDGLQNYHSGSATVQSVRPWPSVSFRATRFPLIRHLGDMNVKSGAWQQ